MLERYTTWSDPLALVRHSLPLLPAADGSAPAHWAMARALCCIAEHTMLRAAAEPNGLLSALALAEVSAGTDKLGRLLFIYRPPGDADAQPAWSQVQACLLHVLPVVERLLVAWTTPCETA